MQIDPVAPMEEATCEGCNVRRPIVEMDAHEVYDDPWGGSRIIYTCPDNVGLFTDCPEYRGTIYSDSCTERLFDTSWADFRYFECESCNRVIIRQCPKNGWHSYVRFVDAYEEEWCLKCYEEELFTNGINVVGEDVLNCGRIPGMFLDEDELIARNFTRLESVYVEGNTKEVVQKIKDLTKSYCVIINYSSLAIGGSEGFIEIWTREMTK